MLCLGALPARAACLESPNDEAGPMCGHTAAAGVREGSGSPRAYVCAPIIVAVLPLVHGFKCPHVAVPGASCHHKTACVRLLEARSRRWEELAAQLVCRPQILPTILLLRTAAGRCPGCCVRAQT